MEYCTTSMPLESSLILFLVKGSLQTCQMAVNSPTTTVNRQNPTINLIMQTPQLGLGKWLTGEYIIFLFPMSKLMQYPRNRGYPICSYCLFWVNSMFKTVYYYFYQPYWTGSKLYKEMFMKAPSFIRKLSQYSIKFIVETFLQANRLDGVILHEECYVQKFLSISIARLYGNLIIGDSRLIAYTSPEFAILNVSDLLPLPFLVHIIPPMGIPHLPLIYSIGTEQNKQPSRCPFAQSFSIPPSWILALLSLGFRQMDTTSSVMQGLFCFSNWKKLFSDKFGPKVIRPSFGPSD